MNNILQYGSDSSSLNSYANISVILGKTISGAVNQMQAIEAVSGKN